jgi:Cd2+/Zn2+-exporting ATPase
MDSRRTDSTESASEKMTSFNASTPPVASAVATTACAVLGVTGAILHQMTFSSAQLWSITACMGAYVAGGYGPTWNAFISLLNKKLNVDLLMVIAAIGAAIIGDWIEGVVLLFLFSLSGTLEAFAIFRTNQSIESLVKLRPREAWLVLGGNREDKRIPVESLQIDDVIRIRSGERFSVERRKGRARGAWHE